MYALRPLKLVFDMVLRKQPGLIFVFDEELHKTADFILFLVLCKNIVYQCKIMIS